MRKLILVIFCTILFASCKKESDPIITGTVQQQGGCTSNTWLVHIPGGDIDKYSFLCKSEYPTSSFNCSNAIYILNMPASFQQLGKRIKFSKWKDLGALCLSSSFASHHLEVYDLSAE